MGQARELGGWLHVGLGRMTTPPPSVTIAAAFGFGGGRS